MKKYVLHGGNTRVDAESNLDFFREIMSGVGSDEQILFCYFAKEDEEARAAFLRDEQRFRGFGFAGRIIMADGEDFLAQIRESAAVYFIGGSIQRLFDTVESCEGAREALMECEVLAGSSAGAYLLSEEYYNRHEGKWGKGMGIAPVRVVGHYTDEDFGDNVVYLRECEFKTMKYEK